MYLNSSIAVQIGANTSTFRYRSSTKDGAAVYFDTTNGISYNNAAKIVLRMAAPSNDAGRFTHIGEVRLPFQRVVNGVTSTVTANLSIQARVPGDLTGAELMAVSDHLKALAGESLLARALRDRTEAGWPPSGGNNASS